MGKIRLGTDEIKYITLFETLTGAKVKDCVQEDNAMGFLVKEGEMGLAIGKGGANIEKVKKTIGKSIWVMEFSENIEQFIKNLFQPIRIQKVSINDSDNDKTATIEVRKGDRRKVIGHEGKRIKLARKLAKRHHAVGNINIDVV